MARRGEHALQQGSEDGSVLATFAAGTRIQVRGTAVAAAVAAGVGRSVIFRGIANPTQLPFWADEGAGSEGALGSRKEC
jgi:hypothetical protein